MVPRGERRNDARLGYPCPPVRPRGADTGGATRRIRRGVAAAVLLLPLAFVFLRCAVSSDVPFIVQRPEAPWIMAPLPVSARLQQWGKEQAPRVSFRRRFPAAASEAAASLRLRAMGRYRLHVNGAVAPGGGGDGSEWRRERRVELGGLLRDGENEVRVDVANRRGPALLSLRSEGLATPLRSDTSWSVDIDGERAGQAIRADDTRILALALAVETPGEAVLRKLDALLLLLTLGGVGFLAARRFLPGGSARALPGAALALAGLAWLGLFFAKAARIPLAVGFDARHHVAYMRYLLEERALPLAADGWSTFHPPLFHAASALVAALGGSGAALKVIPFFSGLGIVGAAFLLARRLFPGDVSVHTLAVVFAATLPVNLYSACYFSNEVLHAFLVSLALLGTTALLLAPRAEPGRLALLGAVFGLAALAKFSVLVVLPVAFLFLACRIVLVDRTPPAGAAGRLAAFVGAFLLVAGWFYARNWLHYGTPIVGNWALPGADQAWWQQPGFHTPAWYTGFGEALRHPYLAGFHSFWDGTYSTFWGDGFIGGRADPSQRHTFWDYGFMSVGYWAALPATALLLFGALRCLRLALQEGSARRSLALGFLAAAIWAGLLAFFYLTLQLPFFAQAKAAYLLMLTAPLALCFALGAARVDRWLAQPRRLPLRVVFHAWLVLYAGSLFLSYAG